MRGLTDKIVIVAGGASGIGAAATRRLVDEGAAVMVGDLNEEGAEKLAAELREIGGRVAACGFNIADDESCASLVAATVEAFGGVDGLFNVAADLSPRTFGRDGDLLEVPLDVWRQSLEVNLTGYFLTARHALPVMLARGGGAIVNTISGRMLNGDPTLVAYGSSKSGVIALSKHIATRWGKQGIRCNVVAPGFVLTEVAQKTTSAESQAAIFEMLRSPRFGRPEDIAAAVSFLLSADGEWINGQVLPVNGGTGLR